LTTGDTAANAGVLTLLDSYEETKNLPVLLKTAAASTTAALWRIILMPIDTLKTIKVPLISNVRIFKRAWRSDYMLKTAAASTTAALWRIILMPIDRLKIIKVRRLYQHSAYADRCTQCCIPIGNRIEQWLATILPFKPTALGRLADSFAVFPCQFRSKWRGRRGSRCWRARSAPTAQSCSSIGRFEFES
jgi:hypothetical protein